MKRSCCTNVKTLIQQLLLPFCQICSDIVAVNSAGTPCELQHHLHAGHLLPARFLSSFPLNAWPNCNFTSITPARS